MTRAQASEGQFQENPMVSKGKSSLQSYLEYYQTLRSPGYAVLVTGAWGVGKTFQVKDYLRDAEHCYVSLFGIQNVEQLHEQVLAALLNSVLEKAALDSRIRKLLPALGELGQELSASNSWLRALQSPVKMLIRDRLDVDRVMVFDDLERCQIPEQEKLGAINHYVEHRGCRVIVIAHEDKATAEFPLAKEKMFGQTIRVTPDLESAFSAFLDTISNSQGKEFVAAHRDTVARIFATSGEQSLRILRHLLEDLARLRICLIDKHMECDDAIQHVVELFSALNIELRSGRLNAEDLRDRMGIFISSRISLSVNQDQPAPTRLDVAIERYRPLDLCSPALTDDTLISLLVEGKYDGELIQKSLDESSYFADPLNAAPWKLVWNFDTLSDEIVQEAIQRMHAQFQEREVTDTGEMLHIFALRLLLSRHGNNGISIEDEVKECIRYIDDLESLARLQKDLDQDFGANLFKRSAYGHGFFVPEENSEAFRKIEEYLEQALERVFQQSLVNVAEEILHKMQSDPKSILEMIAHTNNGPNPYARTPVLHLISPQDFARAWIDSSPEQLRIISTALEIRYANGKLQNELEAERKWAIKLHDTLLELASTLPGLAAFRVQRSIPSAIKEIATIDVA